jgi:hypothetical protein
MSSVSIVADMVFGFREIERVCLGWKVRRFLELGKTLLTQDARWEEVVLVRGVDRDLVRECETWKEVLFVRGVGRDFYQRVRSGGKFYLFVLAVDEGQTIHCMLLSVITSPICCKVSQRRLVLVVVVVVVGGKYGAYLVSQIVKVERCIRVGVENGSVTNVSHVLPCPQISSLASNLLLQKFTLKLWLVQNVDAAGIWRCGFLPCVHLSHISDVGLPPSRHLTSYSLKLAICST